MPLPHIAILTATKGRRQHLPFQMNRVRELHYPRTCITWIITDTATGLDDGWDDILRQWKENWPRILYFKLPEETTLGRSRNIGIEVALLKTEAQYIFIMDDDDIISLGRFLVCVRMFLENPQYDVIGSSCAVLYNVRDQCMITTESHGNSHTIEPYIGFRRSFIEVGGRRFDDTDTRGGLGQFLSNFSIPILQVAPSELALIIGHDENTFDKYQMEVYRQAFRIKDVDALPLERIYDMFEVDREGCRAFQSAYGREQIPFTPESKRAYFLDSLERQYTFDSARVDSDDAKMIKSYEYAGIKEFIQMMFAYIMDYKSLREIVELWRS